MKTNIVFFIIGLLVVPVFATETNKQSQSENNTMPPMRFFHGSDADNKPEQRGSAGPQGRGGEPQVYNLKLMERVLRELGISDEQRKQMFALQEDHMKKMTANTARLNTARMKLSQLQDSGATMDKLDIAIEEVSKAQTEQLQILVRNRLEMERILGKEKNDLMMQKAREFYQQYERRPGPAMLPRPNIPNVPMSYNQGGGMPPVFFPQPMSNNFQSLPFS